jgi:hypothetical protein
MGPVTVMLTHQIPGTQSVHVWAGEAFFPGSTDNVKIVAKLAFEDEEILQMSDEAQLYQYLMPNYPQNPSALPLPTFYGHFQCLFHNDEYVANLLLMSYVHGTNLDDPEQLCTALWVF